MAYFRPNDVPHLQEAAGDSTLQYGAQMDRRQPEQTAQYNLNCVYLLQNGLRFERAYVKELDLHLG